MPRIGHDHWKDMTDLIDKMKASLCPVWSRVENKKEGKMYGLLLESVQFYVIQDVGEETWKKILEHAGVKNIVFTTHNTYRDELMTLLAQSCCQVTKTKDYNQWMTFFGTCFVDFCRSYGYDKLLRVTGRNYRDFLHGIDNIHEVIRFSYPRLQSPAFLVLAEDKDGCVMLYQTKRRGFKHYVIGQLQQVAKRFYNISVSISVIEEEIIDRKTHVKFRLDFDNSAYKPKPEPKQTSGILNFSSITGDTFLKNVGMKRQRASFEGVLNEKSADSLPNTNLLITPGNTMIIISDDGVFPFCIVFNSQLVIRMVGRSMIALLKGDNLIGATLREKFHIRRPLIPCIWSKILQFRRVIFEVEYLFDNDPSLLDARLIEYDNSEAEKAPEERILLRGQMKYLQEWNMIAFLCTPLLCDLKDLQKAGLFINDLNSFDMSRDMVMAGWQHASQLERSIEEQRGKSEKIAENMVKIEEWKEKSDSLLYNMIPKSVAGKLKSGDDPIATCEVFDNVTIMFNYMVGFGDVCSSATPMQIVEIINTVFSLFDQIIDSYDVFKVETLGDAVYMVAGGVPDRNPNHAVNVAGLALELQQKAKTLTEPWSKDYMLNTRIGMHTGSVVGGVVGRRMPQYCLFGDTVNTASRMQTYSLPGRIHISEPCQQCLKDSSFVTIVRGTVNVKGKGEMRTFWLAGKEGEESTRKFCEEIKQERNEAVRKYSSYENAMDLHAMHASTSFAQMPAYFGGMKSNRSASSISLSTLQQSDDEGDLELKAGERFSIGKRNSNSSVNRLSENKKAQEDEDQPTAVAMFENAEPFTIHIDSADDVDNKRTTISYALETNIQKSPEKGDNTMRTKFNIPRIVEHDEVVPNEQTNNVNTRNDEVKQRLTLTKFKLSLPKLSDLSRFATPVDTDKSKSVFESRECECQSNVDEDKNDTGDNNSTAVPSKIKVFLGSDEGLSSYDTDNGEEIFEADDIEPKNFGETSQCVTFSLSKSASSLSDITEELCTETKAGRAATISCDYSKARSLNHNTQRKIANNGKTSSDKGHRAALGDKIDSKNTQNDNFITFEKKSVENFDPHCAIHNKSDVLEKSSCSKGVHSENSLINGYLEDKSLENITRVCPVQSSAHKDSMEIKMLSCPFFSSIANGNTNGNNPNEDDALSTHNLRKCKSDQGYINGNQSDSNHIQLQHNLNLNEGKRISGPDSLVQNNKICSTLNESMHDQVKLLGKSSNATQSDKLKLFGTGVKIAWDLNDNTDASIDSGREKAETYKGNITDIRNTKNSQKKEMLNQFSTSVFHAPSEDVHESK